MFRPPTLAVHPSGDNWPSARAARENVAGAFGEDHRRCMGGSVEVDVNCVAGVVRSELF